MMTDPCPGLHLPLTTTVGYALSSLGYAPAVRGQGKMSQDRCIHHATIPEADLEDSAVSKRHGDASEFIPVLPSRARRKDVAASRVGFAARVERPFCMSQPARAARARLAGKPYEARARQDQARAETPGYSMTSMQQPLEQYESAGQVPPAPQVMTPLGQLWPVQLGGKVLGS